jgi:hypothetical protein
MKTKAEVIKAMEQCLNESETCVDCAYFSRAHCLHAIMTDALVLLQDPAVPESREGATRDQLRILEGLLSSCGAWFTPDVEDALRAVIRAAGGLA